MISVSTNDHICLNCRSRDKFGHCEVHGMDKHSRDTCEDFHQPQAPVWKPVLAVDNTKKGA